MFADFKWVARAYSEFANAPRGYLNRWGNSIFFGEPSNVYWDPGFIRQVFTDPISRTLPKGNKCVIGDFGAGDGHVSEIVGSQMKQLYDCHISPIGIDRYDEDLWREKPKPIIKTVQGDLKDLPFALDSFHAGILSFVLFFIGEKEQRLVLEQIHNVMKDNAVLVVLNYGAFSEDKTAKAYNKLLSGYVAAADRRSIDEVVAENRYTSCEKLGVMAREAHFGVLSMTDLTNAAFGYTSPEIYGRAARFKDDQLAILEKLYKECKQEGIIPFERDSLRAIRPMYTCVLQKKPSP